MALYMAFMVQNKGNHATFFRRKHNKRIIKQILRKYSAEYGNRQEVKETSCRKFIILSEANRGNMYPSAP